MELSIVIPAYNMESYITNTLKSIINSSHKQFEIILVDDGSTDHTYEIAEELLLKSEMTNYKIIKQVNGGVSSARNRGLLECSGNYVVFLDGDDYIDINLVGNIYKYTADEEKDVICWGYNIVTDDKLIIQSYFEKYDSNFKSMNGGEALNDIIRNKSMWVWTGSAAYRKAFLLEHNLNHTLGCTNGEDLEFIYKSLSRAKKVVFINKILSHYVQRKGSVTNSFNIKRFDAIFAMRRTYEYINKVDNEGKLNNVSIAIRDNLVLLHYLTIFNNSVKYFCGKSINRKNINFIINEIDKNYPGLIREMFIQMKNYKGKDIKLFIRIKAFLFSPYIYIWLSNIKSRWAKL